MCSTGTRRELLHALIMFIVNIDIVSGAINPVPYFTRPGLNNQSYRLLTVYSHTWGVSYRTKSSSVKFLFSYFIIQRLSLKSLRVVLSLCCSFSFSHGFQEAITLQTGSCHDVCEPAISWDRLRQYLGSAFGGKCKKDDYIIELLFVHRALIPLCRERFFGQFIW